MALPRCNNLVVVVVADKAMVAQPVGSGLSSQHFVVVAVAEHNFPGIVAVFRN